MRHKVKPTWKNYDARVVEHLRNAPRCTLQKFIPCLNGPELRALLKIETQREEGARPSTMHTITARLHQYRKDAVQAADEGRPLVTDAWRVSLRSKLLKVIAADARKEAQREQAAAKRIAVRRVAPNRKRSFFRARTRARALGLRLSMRRSVFCIYRPPGPRPKTARDPRVCFVGSPAMAVEYLMRERSRRLKSMSVEVQDNQ